MWLSQKIWPPQPPPTPKKADPAVQAPKPVAADPVKTDPVNAEPVKPDAAPASYPEKPPIALSSKHLDVILVNKGAGVEGITLQHPKDRRRAPPGQGSREQPAVPRVPRAGVRRALHRRRPLRLLDRA